MRILNIVILIFTMIHVPNLYAAGNNPTTGDQDRSETVEAEREVAYVEIIGVPDRPPRRIPQGQPIIPRGPIGETFQVSDPQSNINPPRGLNRIEKHMLDELERRLAHGEITPLEYNLRVNEIRRDANIPIDI